MLEYKKIYLFIFFMRRMIYNQVGERVHRYA